MHAETVGGLEWSPGTKSLHRGGKCRDGRSFNPDEFAIALEQVVAGARCLMTTASPTRSRPHRHFGAGIGFTA
jgi:hypothetical protein